MSNLDEAYNQIRLSDAVYDSFDDDINAELSRMIHDRETIYNNIHVQDTLFQDKPFVNKEEIEATLKEYNMDAYIGECSKYKQVLIDILKDISIADADYKESKANAELINDICDNIKIKFSTELHALESTNKILDKYKSLNDLHDSKLRSLKSKLFIMHKFSPHYINNDPRKLCSICVNREVELANVPCGHTLCSECCNMIVSRECFFCRTEIEKVIKLYFT
jgi:hypothetical protein